MAIETRRRWMLPMLHRLPDDGNSYELIEGRLFVSPGPLPDHEFILAMLTELLTPFVSAHELGHILHPRAVFKTDRSEVEPDLMVRRRGKRGVTNWALVPVPLLVVEVLSPATRSRDYVEKRRLYLKTGIEEYWIVDPLDQTIRSIRADRRDVVTADTLVWLPSGVTASLAIDVPSVFDFGE